MEVSAIMAIYVLAGYTVVMDQETRMEKKLDKHEKQLLNDYRRIVPDAQWNRPSHMSARSLWEACSWNHDAGPTTASNKIGA